MEKLLFLLDSFTWETGFNALIEATVKALQVDASTSPKRTLFMLMDETINSK